MKRLIIPGFIAVLLFNLSCEKSSYSSDNIVDTPENPYKFPDRILEDYFVTTIAFDKDGNTWIGTFMQGLIKYNSEKTIVYNSENSVFTDSTVIRDIEIDSKGNVWIGADGLVKYDGTGFTLYNTKNSAIPEDYISAVAIDQQDNIWFSSSRFREGGLVKYDGVDWHVYTPDNSSLPVNLIQDVITDKSDNVWVAQSEIVNKCYLTRISGNNWSVFSDDDFGFKPCYFGKMAVNAENEVFVSVDYSLSGTIVSEKPKLIKYSNEFMPVIFPEEDNDIGKCYSIYIDNSSDIWMACMGSTVEYGLFLNNQWFFDKVNSGVNSVFAINQSEDGKIWMGTGNGIYISR